jgi:hypothetical protein
MNSKVVLLALVSSSLVVVACGKDNLTPSSSLSASQDVEAWIPADAEAVEDQFGSLLRREGLVAACLIKPNLCLE